MTKFGMKRNSSKKSNSSNTYKKRVPLKLVSAKQAQENLALKKVVNKLKKQSGNRSELSGEFSPYLEPHHLSGRGKNLCNPFSIILITRSEHLIEQKHMGYEHKQELIAKIKPIRLSQGFKEEDYS